MDAKLPSSEPTSPLPAEHPAIPGEKIGVLLINLGTPDAPEPKAVKRYLAEFLSDTRIVDLPRALWLPILHGVILNVRPRATAANYAKIWLEESGESPLRFYTRQQATLLQSRITDDKICIDWAMRYGSPSVASKLDHLREQGCTRILIIPLYPQYSATTTASAMDAVFDALKEMRWQPALRTTPPFHDDPNYINALAEITKRELSKLDWTPERVVISFHGLPERYFLAGDPYHCHCQKSGRLLREKMGWTDDFAPLAFQSIFGREKWLEPATDDTIEALAASNVKNIAVIMPGFTADCIETLEEIDIAARETFMDAGGEHFHSIPCLNDADETIAMLETIARRELAGWIA